jgi:hypothetical protein
MKTHFFSRKLAKIAENHYQIGRIYFTVTQVNHIFVLLFHRKVSHTYT